MESTSWRPSIAQNPSIQFNMERELEGSIAFLDVQMERRGATALTSVFHKQTHTDRYLNFNSPHPAQVLRGVVQRLKVRVEKVCDKGKWWQEIQHLRQVFRASGYPEPVVKRNLRGRPTPTNTTIESETPPKHLLLMSEVSVNKARRADRWEWEQWWSPQAHSEAYSKGEAVQTRHEVEGCSLRVVMQGLPMCVHWWDRKNLGERLSEHRIAVKKNDPKNRFAVRGWARGKSQLGRRFSQAREKRLLEEKDPF